MFGFLRRSSMRRLSPSIVRALENDGLPPGMDVATLGMVRSNNWFADRKVTYFRIFDPVRAAAHGADVSGQIAYRDLDAHLDLVLRAGFVERDGRVVIFSRSPDTYAMRD